MQVIYPSWSWPRQMGPGTHPLSRSLAYSYLPQSTACTSETLTGQLTSPGVVPPEVLSGSFASHVWSSGGEANKNVKTNLTAGWTKNQTYYSIAGWVKCKAAPLSTTSASFASEPVADSNTSVRFQLTMSNGALGTTGNKMNVSFRTGAAASTRRDVNAGAGGTVIAANDVVMAVFTFDSVADLYTLYVNGLRETQLSVAESAVANTNPLTAPFLLSDVAGGQLCNGQIAGLHVWQGRVLTPSDVQDLYSDFYLPIRIRRAQSFTKDSSIRLMMNIGHRPYPFKPGVPR